MATTLTQPKVSGEVPGPKVRAALGRGTFDMQAFYRAMVIDDAASSGCYVVDLDGNAYLDLFSNFALGALGYNHPALVETARGDAFVRAAVNPTSTPFVTSASWLDFVDSVTARFAPKGMAKMFCVDGGGEGVEAALKAAFIVHGERRRKARGLPEDPTKLGENEQQAIMHNRGTDAVVLSFDGAFHGRGLGPISATHSKLMHKADLPAFPWPTLPFPALRFPLERYAEENARREAECLKALERALDEHAGRVAAILVEPLQSEGGDRHAAPTFFQGLQRLAHAAGAALVLDEVQTGVAITGTLWAHEQLGLGAPPDMVCFGKKMQLGGFFARPEFDIRQFGRMYQTRNGDRARGLLALATLKAIDGEQLLANVRTTGALFLRGLEDLGARYPALVEQPRGWGFLLAFDMPTVEARNDFLKRCLARGVFATYTGVRSVRLRPHLITRAPQVEQALAVFDAVLRDMS